MSGRKGAGEKAGPAAEPGGVRLLRPVVLVGMMGAGKTTVGMALAKLLNVPFRDSDEEIVRAAQMQIPEIFARDGEAFFRARETEVIARLLSDEPAIISTGGGAFLSETNRALIAGKAVSVWLRADLELLWQRVRHRSTRPLLKTADPKATLTALLAERTPLYTLAELAVDAEPGQSVPAMAEKVLAALAALPETVAGEVPPAGAGSAPKPKRPIRRRRKRSGTAAKHTGAKHAPAKTMAAKGAAKRKRKRGPAKGRPGAPKDGAGRKEGE